MDGLRRPEWLDVGKFSCDALGCSSYGTRLLFCKGLSSSGRLSKARLLPPSQTNTSGEKAILAASTRRIADERRHFLNSQNWKSQTSHTPTTWDSEKAGWRHRDQFRRVEEESTENVNCSTCTDSSETAINRGNITGSETGHLVRLSEMR